MSIAVVFNGMASERSDDRCSCDRNQNDTCNSPRQNTNHTAVRTFETRKLLAASAFNRYRRPPQSRRSQARKLLEAKGHPLLARTPQARRVHLRDPAAEKLRRLHQIEIEARVLKHLEVQNNPDSRAVETVVSHRQSLHASSTRIDRELLPSTQAQAHRERKDTSMRTEMYCCREPALRSSGTTEFQRAQSSIASSCPNEVARSNALKLK